MKLFLSILFLFILPATVFCQQPDQNLGLVARRNNNEFVIPIGKKYRITYLENGQLKKIKAFYIGADKNNIYMASRNGKDETVINLDSMQSIRKSNSKFRWLMGISGGMGLIGSIALIDEVGNRPGAGYALILIIPLVGYSAYALGAVPISMIIEKLTEKSVKKGWQFSIQRK